MERLLLEARKGTSLSYPEIAERSSRKYEPRITQDRTDIGKEIKKPEFRMTKDGKAQKTARSRFVI